MKIVHRVVGAQRIAHRDRRLSQIVRQHTAVGTIRRSVEQSLPGLQGAQLGTLFLC